MLFRILYKVIACLIIRRRSRVCQFSVSTRVASWAGCSSMVVCHNSGSVVLNSFEVIYLGACMWVPNR